jgi:hypothetical protein
MNKIAIILLLIVSANAQSTKVKRSVSATTNVQAGSNTYKLSGTVGQNAIGLSTKDQSHSAQQFHLIYMCCFQPEHS